MRKIIALTLFLCLSNIGYSQEIYFLTGKNYSRYQLKYNGSESVNTLPKKGSGDAYEIGIAFPIKIQRLAFDNNLNYTLGLTLNQYNVQAGDEVRNYEWATDYVGVTNGLVFSFLQTDHVDLAVKGGLNVGTIVSGSQKINNSRLNLTNQEDFKGINFSPMIGFQAKCNLSEYGYLSLGYNHSKSFNLSNSSDKKVSFVTHQVVFGISFELY